jgi:hypothetical protein
MVPEVNKPLEEPEPEVKSDPPVPEVPDLKEK